MVQIKEAGAEAKGRLVVGLRGPAWRQPYIDAIQALAGDHVLEFVPEEGESLRQIRVRAARASKELGKAVRAGETQEGTLLVWLAEPTQLRQRRRRRILEQTEGQPEYGLGQTDVYRR
jgi:hypothetical protein